ncbi:hypothetical protein A1O1_04494 [Capronia coronata CBS 617.96]|uniref:DUF1750-domain-containing protein n=1 Tax=Capronia coronata CBS 617.96 TaxID=1182541 RepID=W9YEV3_9EURO|nr:uncharacterized protein A1O1_04494 [Capronia coronata CBS 617.96]EXJ91382.1 hypothetical protein A1O1_04494 [Capronia coronata CBS 617.96]
MNPVLKDPAAGIPAPLLPHLHLVSKYRYPITSNPSFETIVGYLLEAPKIVRDLQPVQWQFIETPPDGTMMLTWQPLEHMGTNFASDGYIWADAEHVFKSEVRGYILEMYLQRSGYRASGEQVACHSRRRYRLLPGNPNLGLPNPDPALFLTHYSKASSRDHVAASSIPVMPAVHAQLQQRRMIQSQGQLPRKEFMLHDRSNWPAIHLPPAVARAAAPGPVAPASGHRRGLSIAPDPTLEEEEDVSRGDLLDFMSPRDISRLRYEQHHEWMEEILESPYPTLSIVPSDLGLGRKGALEELTKDFLAAPISAGRDSANGPPQRVGKLPDGKAEEFAQRASAKLADMQLELERMRKRHARRMEKLNQSTALKVAEKKLRMAPTVPEKRRLSNESTEAGESKPKDAVEEIMHEVESTTGKKLCESTGVRLVAKGGLQEKPKPPPVSQAPAAPVASAPPQPVNPPIAETESNTQPQPAAAAGGENVDENKASTTSNEQQAVTTGAQPPPPEPKPEVSSISGQQSEADGGQHDGTAPPAVGDSGADIHMDGLDDNDHGDNGNQEGNEWVMVDQDGQTAEEVALPNPTNVGQQPEAQPVAGNATGQPNQTTTDQPATTQTQPSQETALDTPNFDIGGDFDNVDVDTAGDALASYGHDEELNLDGMEDSAFGDAFHPEEDEEMS